MKFSALLFLAIFIYTTNTYSQKIIVNGQESDGKLVWANFTGNVDRSSGMKAFTAYKFYTKFAGVQFKGDTALLQGFEVTLALDQANTWAIMDKVTDSLLLHEQGHFNLGILCVKEIAATVRQTTFTKTGYNAQLQTIINSISKKYADLGVQYDTETNHSKNSAQQAKWNQFFSEVLKEK